MIILKYRRAATMYGNNTNNKSHTGSFYWSAKFVKFNLWVHQVEMGDIRQSLLPRDVLSAAKELLYHLDIYISNLVQSGRQPPQVDTKTLELVEEFILHAPKDRSALTRVRHEANAVHAPRQHQS